MPMRDREDLRDIDIPSVYACNSAVVQNRAKRRMAARQRAALYYDDTLGNTGHISCD